MEHPIGQLGDRAGTLSAQAAALTGLPEGIAVAVGNVDADITAPAAQAVEPGQMVAIMGTSTCHVMSSDRLAEVPGMCGVVDGGIVSGRWGYEAGQSGVGDIFGWFVKTGVPGEYAAAAERSGETVHQLLTRLASDQEVASTGWSRSTGTAATAPSWWTTSSRASWSARPSRPGPRTPTVRCSRRPPSARA